MSDIVLPKVFVQNTPVNALDIMANFNYLRDYLSGAIVGGGIEAAQVATSAKIALAQLSQRRAIQYLAFGVPDPLNATVRQRRHYFTALLPCDVLSFSISLAKTNPADRSVVTVFADDDGKLLASHTFDDGTAGAWGHKPGAGGKPLFSLARNKRIFFQIDSSTAMRYAMLNVAIAFEHTSL